MRLKDIEDLYREMLYRDGKEAEELELKRDSPLAEYWHESFWQPTDNISQEEWEETLQIHARHREKLFNK